jgi:hypothetical protein
MQNLDLVGFLIGYTSVAALALYLLDRSHRSAFAKLSQIYDQQTATQDALLRTLNTALDSLKEERHGLRPTAKTNVQAQG